MKKKVSRKKRVLRVRKRLQGNEQKPRLSVFRSNKNLQAQLIDDEKGETIAYSGTLSKDNKNFRNKKSKEAAKEIGKQIAEMALKKNIKTVVFDRGRFKYHGLIAILANSAREAGLQF